MFPFVLTDVPVYCMIKYINAFDLSKLEGFEWDQANLGHIKKHHVVYIECEEVFSNKPLLVSKDEAHSIVEQRFQALGKTDKERLLFISFTIRENHIRIISARDLNKKEVNTYEKT